MTRNHSRRSRRCPMTGKRRYLTELDAKIALMEIRARDNLTREKLEQRVYLCQCKGWHLTAQPRRSKEPS